MPATLSTGTTRPDQVRAAAIARPSEAGPFLRRAARFVAVGLLLYGALYAAAEWLVHRHAERNRFYTIQTAPPITYDYVILGASHAAVFDYRDMNARLEEMTGAEVINLATVGAGIVPNRFLLDYFFSKHEAEAVVYVLDSFAFHSSEWNEDRMQDTELYVRAPFDPALAARMVRDPATRGVALDYLTGFSKINNPDRFEPDLFEAEGSTFDRRYRPIAQLDRQRLEYLYPAGVGGASLDASPYLAAFEALIDEVQSRGARFIVIRPPMPERIYEMIPGEAEFDERIRSLAADRGFELYDFTGVNNEPELFYDSDHLNQEGVLSFYENHLAEVLR